jgi:adenosylhomocysteinase
MVSEVDPICALQAAMEGYEVATMEDAAPRADIFVTATGNVDVITIEHMRKMKHRPSSPTSATDSEIQIGAAQLQMAQRQAAGREIEFPDGKRIILLSEGCLVNSATPWATRAVMSSSFTNQTLAQIELWTNPASTRTRSTRCRSTSTRRSRGCTSQDR